MLNRATEMRSSVIELLGKGHFGHTYARSEGAVRCMLDLVELDNSPFDLFDAGGADKVSDMAAIRTVFRGDVVYQKAC